VPLDLVVTGLQLGVLEACCLLSCGPLKAGTLSQRQPLHSAPLAVYHLRHTSADSLLTSAMMTGSKEALQHNGRMKNKLRANTYLAAVLLVCKLLVSDDC
jgi:hypothetical protein